MIPSFLPAKRCSLATILALLSMAAAQAYAAPATYNLVLKQGGVALTCARGAFVFDKAALAPTATSGVASSVEVIIDKDCFLRPTRGNPNARWPASDLIFAAATPVTIHLKNLVVKNEQPVPSVFGVTGALSSGNNRIEFAYNTLDPQRTARVCDNSPCNANSSVAVMTYHAYNLNSVPEPETLALLLLGALGMGYARWSRRRG